MAALYPFENGSHRFTTGANGECDIALTVSNGNHVNVDCVTGGCNINVNIGNISANSETAGDRYLNGLDWCATKFSLKTGDVIRTVATTSALHTHTGNFSIYCREAESMDGMDFFNGNTTGESTVTMAKDLDVGSIGLWTNIGNGTVLDVTVEIYVNDVRYV